MPDGLRQCANCGAAFSPTCRTQLYCKRPTCVRERRRKYMKEYLKLWRLKHPSYWKTPRTREYQRKYRELRRKTATAPVHE